LGQIRLPRFWRARAEGNSKMANVSSIITQLKKERDRVAKQLSGMEAALRAFAGVYGVGKPIRKRRKMSARSRAKIAAAQRTRWAKCKAEELRVSSCRPFTCG
jgi:hypothetical protein